MALNTTILLPTSCHCQKIERYKQAFFFLTQTQLVLPKNVVMNFPFNIFMWPSTFLLTPAQSAGPED